MHATSNGCIRRWRALWRIATPPAAMHRAMPPRTPPSARRDAAARLATRIRARSIAPSAASIGASRSAITAADDACGSAPDACAVYVDRHDVTHARASISPANVAKRAWHARCILARAMRRTLLSLSAASLFTALAVACGGSVDAPASATGNDAGAAGSSVSRDGGSSGVVVVVHDAGTTVTQKKDASSTTTCTEGSPCAKEGEYCSPQPCTDPCQFCNSMQCIYGQWQQIEAAPLPPDQCADTFPCGASTCSKGNFCNVMYAGVALPDGGTVPPTYVCLPLDPSCMGGCSCAISAAKKSQSCQPASCASPSGGPVVQCYGI